MLESAKKIFRQLFAFFSSLQLAVFLLLSLAAILAVGTILESLHDTETAGYYIYHTWWFVAFLGVLGLNVLCAGLSRYPWKRHHTGFLVVHLGILVILTGSLISLFYGFEGQLIIPEGQNRDRIFLPESAIYFYDRDSGQLNELPANFRFEPPTSRAPHGGKVLENILVRVIDYLPNATMEEEVQESSGEVNPALEISLEGKRGNLTEWLFSRDISRQNVDLGPAHVAFIEVPEKTNLKRLLKDEKMRGPVLWAWGQWIPVRGNLGQKINLGSRRLTIKNLLPHGAVFQGRLVNLSDEPMNPVALVTVQKGGEEIEQTLFSKFPEMHGGSGSLRLFWFPPELGKKANELVLVKADDGSLSFARKNRGKWSPIGKIKLGQAQTTGWMDFQFRVDEVRNRAQVVRKFRRAPVPKGKSGPPPAVHLQIAGEGDFKDFWLGRGQSEDIQLGSKNLKVAYALRSVPLGFSVKLKDFIMGTYEGTQNPSSYESLVAVSSPSQGAPREHRISMNQPLRHGKFKIFQASYQLDPQGPDWSVFSVAYDPGTPIKYAGSIVLILGIVIIFYFRKAYLSKAVISSLVFCCLATPAFAAPRESAVPQPKEGIELEELRAIAILEKGRKKPLDTFSRETVRFITGKENYQGFDPTELLLSWLTNTQAWEESPLILIEYRPLIDHLGLPVQDHRVSPKALAAHEEFRLFVQATAARQEQGLDLSEMEREGARLSQKLQTFYLIAEGANLKVFPRAQGGWESLAELAKRFPKISLHQAAPSIEAKVAAGVQGLLLAYHQGDSVHFGQIAALLGKVLRTQGESVGNYPELGAMQREIHFNRFKPFRWAWVAYALACFCLLLSFAVPGRWLYRIGFGVFGIAFLIHCYGFVLRSWISGRPPVTNMYETVLWIPFGAALFAIIFEFIYRKRIFLLAGGLMATLGLIVADSAPGVLDPSINPLVPVLRNNFWLTIHVLTITLSYGAFTLALGVANFNAGIYIFRPDKTSAQKTLNLFIYRAIQIGVILLAAGTILGGVWANQSWGRFWGWDPKEVWALIALLGYLALLHGRFVGWVRGLGLTLGAIVAYLLILMAWYGVNFVLGAGLHSYGFSSGGAKFVISFVAAELAWVALAVLRTKVFPIKTA